MLAQFIEESCPVKCFCAMDLVKEADKEEIRKIFETDEAQLKRDIDILKEWLRKQPHLPQGIQDDFFYENMLIRNKCRVERAKNCIDAYYTYRTIWPDVFENVKNLVPSKCNAIVLPLRSLTKDKERVILFSLKSNDLDIYSMKDFSDMLIAVSEILLKEDYNAGIRLVSDNRNFSATCLSKVSPSLLKKMEKVFMDAYASRVTGIHFIDQASWVTALMTLIKAILPRKIYERIKVHGDHESLWEEIPRKLLPKDYGGGDKTLDELMAEWDGIFAKHQNIFQDMSKFKSKEALRMGPCKYETDTFGVEGTFKRLNLD